MQNKSHHKPKNKQTNPGELLITSKSHSKPTAVFGEKQFTGKGKLQMEISDAFSFPVEG